MGLSSASRVFPHVSCRLFPGGIIPPDFHARPRVSATLKTVFLRNKREWRKSIFFICLQPLAWCFIGSDNDPGEIRHSPQIP
jgi:hypothetical protein